MVVESTNMASEPAVAPAWTGSKVSASCSTLGAEGPVDGGRMNDGTSNENAGGTPASSSKSGVPAELPLSVAPKTTSAGRFPLLTTQKFSGATGWSRMLELPKTPRLLEVEQPAVTDVPKARTAP